MLWIHTELVKGVLNWHLFFKKALNSESHKFHNIYDDIVICENLYLF